MNAVDAPGRRFLDGLAESRLLYQFDCLAGCAVFYPRTVGPSGVPDALEWRESAGLGTVYSHTRHHRRDGFADLVLVDLDEGFRMMSLIPVAPPAGVRIGQRVRASVQPWEDVHRVVFEVLT